MLVTSDSLSNLSETLVLNYLMFMVFFCAQIYLLVSARMTPLWWADHKQ